MTLLARCLECGSTFHDGMVYCPQCGELNLEPVPGEMQDDPDNESGPLDTLE